MFLCPVFLLSVIVFNIVDKLFIAAVYMRLNADECVMVKFSFNL